jgi:AraC family transcriptional regulator
MFNASDPSFFAVLSPDRSPPSCCNGTLALLVSSATTHFDSNRDAARASLKRAAELLQVSVNQGGRRRNESPILAGGLAAWQAKRLVAYVETNINSNIRVSTLASVVHLSVSHFSRVFKQTFGETPHAYLTRQRIRRAQVIMMRSREPLAQIALHCGMSDQAHFTRAFRKIVGINPGMWRRLVPTAHASPGS